MMFTKEIHKLCLYGDVKLFKLLSSSIDIKEFIITNKSSMSYCISKGAYFNRFFFDLFIEYGIENFHISTYLIYTIMNQNIYLLILAA